MTHDGDAHEPKDAAKPMPRGMGSVFQRGGVWWVSYYHAGRKIRESSGSPKRRAAVNLLKRRHLEMGHGGRPAREAEKVLLSDLRALIDADYLFHRRRSGRRIGISWKQLARAFGEKEPVLAITTPRLAAYVTKRTEEKAAPATIRNELNALKRGFNLARKSGVLLPHELPSFPTVTLSNTRSGFFERAEHEAVRAALPPDEGDVCEFLFWSGWRKGEALGLRWKDVDEKAGIIRIETTKSGEPRTLPYSVLPPLADLIAHRRALTDAVQKARGMVVSHVFTRGGERIIAFNRSWSAACVKAGLGQEVRRPDTLDAGGRVIKRGKLIRRAVARIPHDYRRSAARNLSRAGVPERVIMQLCGWKTRSVFDRYRIVAERDLAEGLARLADAPPATTGRKVARR